MRESGLRPIKMFKTEKNFLNAQNLKKVVFIFFQ